MLQQVESTKTPFKAYKAFKVLKINGQEVLRSQYGTETFVLGEHYTHGSTKPLHICSNTGYHFCRKLKDVFCYYPLQDYHAYYEIEVTGEYLDDTTKSITKSFKIVKEIKREELLNIKITESMEEKLETVQKLCNDFPNTIIGGSLALFLYGGKLDRWKNGSSDIDIAIPYFHGFDNLNKDTNVSTKQYNDYDYSFVIDNIKVDVKIDNKQQYQIIDYKGFKYKAALLPVILKAKAKYALKGNTKHQEDLLELVSGNKPKDDSTEPFF